MRTSLASSVAVVLALGAVNLSAQEIVWSPASPKAAPATRVVSLGQSRPLTATQQDAPVLRQTSNVGIDLPRVVRGQSPPPAPVFPGSGGSAPFTPIPATGDGRYACGPVNNDSDLGGFWTRFTDKARRCWEDVSGSTGGIFRSTPGRKTFGSDREFEFFTSPVSSPFYFEDPRALTEIRPVFTWQNTPNSNPVWSGGNNFTLSARGSVAFTENISVVVSRLGWSWINPDVGAPGISSGNGFSELHLGPKITFYRSRDSKTVMAFGLNFELPVGSSQVLQDTGSLSLEPYFSIAQNFGRSSYGSFNFMNTTGYSFRTDGVRSESLYAGFHLDYNVGDLNRVFPLVELNWRHYARSGSANALNFEGNDLANFGSSTVTGFNEVTLALGGRFRLNNYIDFGIVGEFNVLDNSGGRHLDQFRLTTDLIFRY